MKKQLCWFSNEKKNCCHDTTHTPTNKQHSEKEEKLDTRIYYLVMKSNLGTGGWWWWWWWWDSKNWTHKIIMNFSFFFSSFNLINIRMKRHTTKKQTEKIWMNHYVIYEQWWWCSKTIRMLLFFLSTIECCCRCCILTFFFCNLPFNIWWWFIWCSESLLVIWLNSQMTWHEDDDRKKRFLFLGLFLFLTFWNGKGIFIVIIDWLNVLLWWSWSYSRAIEMSYY